MLLVLPVQPQNEIMIPDLVLCSLMAFVWGANLSLVMHLQCFLGCIMGTALWGQDNGDRLQFGDTSQMRMLSWSCQ